MFSSDVVGCCESGVKCRLCVPCVIVQVMEIFDEFIYTEAILSKKWSFKEVEHLLSSQLAVLPGQLFFLMVAMAQIM